MGVFCVALIRSQSPAQFVLHRSDVPHIVRVSSRYARWIFGDYAIHSVTRNCISISITTVCSRIACGCGHGGYEPA